MNTAAAATQAGVTIPTIRNWCRRGVVAAFKQAGRWIVEAASLAHRIAIGRSTRVEQPKYAVTETPTKYGTIAYTVTRTDGTTKDFRIRSATYRKREQAEIHCAFVNGTPDQYLIHLEQYRSHQRREGHFWKIDGGLNEDPSDFHKTLDARHEITGNWPEGATLADILIRWALQHAEGADQRIAKKAEADAVAAAERAVREARQAHLAEIASTKGELATERQVAYILDLLQARKLSGEGGGFFIGPTKQAEIEELSKAEASMYIRSLKGDY